MNPYSQILSHFGWRHRNQPQGLDAALYMVLKVYEAAYSSGWTAGTAAAYLLTQLSALSPPDQPNTFIDYLRAKFHGEGML